MKNIFSTPIATLAKATILLSLAALAFSTRSHEPEPGIPMCHDSKALSSFAAFSDDQEFHNAHPSPQPIEVIHQGKMVKFPVEGGAEGQGFLMNSHHRTNKFLLLFHEWWGLNDYVKNETAMWCHELGINVLAVDLYDGQVAATPEEAGKLMKANDPARAAAIILGAAKFAGADADFRTMGWCFGGGWSLQAAMLLEGKAKACVVYYGMPETDVDKLKNLASDVLFIHPNEDKWITDKVVADFETTMKSLGKSVTVHHYDANHAFANPSSPRYNEQAAKESRATVKSYLAGK